MLRFFLLTTALFHTLAACAQHPASFPKYKDLFETLRDRTTIRFTSGAPDKVLIKKNDKGYHAIWAHYNNNLQDWELKSAQTIWSPEKGYIAEFVVGEANLRQPMMHQFFATPPVPFNQRTADPFDLFRFYGYEGWMDDLFDFYKINTPTTAAGHSELGALYAFRYSEWIAEHQHELAAPEKTEAWKTLFEWADQASLHYKKAAALNAYAPSLVGSVAMAAANERMGLYLSLILLNKEQTPEAQKVLQQCPSYSPEVLAFAKNLLTSCAPDAILYTQELGNYLPLLYLQKRERYRSDVLVVHTPQLSTPEYLAYLLDAKRTGTAALPSILQPAHYQNNNALLALQYGSEPWSVQRLLQYLTEQPAQIQREIPLSELVLSVGNHPPMELLLTTPLLNRQHLGLLSTLAANQGKRPILFTPPFYQAKEGLLKNLNLNAYIYLQGLAYQLQYTRRSNVRWDEARVLDNYQRYTTTLQWPKIERLQEGYYVALEHYSNTMRELVFLLKRYQNPDKAKALQKHFLEVFGSVLHELPPKEVLALLSSYYQLEQPELGNRLFGQFLDHLIAARRAHEARGIFPKNPTYTKEDLDYIDRRRVLDRLLELCKRYQLRQFEDRLAILNDYEYAEQEVTDLPEKPMEHLEIDDLPEED